MKKLKIQWIAVIVTAVTLTSFVVPSLSWDKNYGVEYLSIPAINAKASEFINDTGSNADKADKIDHFINDPKQDMTVDVQEMNNEELQIFEKLVQEEAEKANLPTKEDTDDYKKTLIELYDSHSSIYQNLEEATDQIINEINANHESRWDKITGEKVFAASHGTISVKLLGGAINLGLSVALGAGASAGIKALVLKVGAKKASNLIAQKTVAILLTFGIKKVSGLDTILSGVIKNLLNPGNYIAKWLDSKDKIKNNGWLEWW